MMKSKLPQKGEQVTAVINGLGHSGEGVGRVNDFTVFIPGALSGETVTATLVEVKKNYARGRLEKILEPSAERVQPPCKVHGRCGGCQLQHLAYPAQLQIKRQQVIDALTRIGKIESPIVHETLGMSDPWHYRNKMQLPVGYANGQLAMGCYAQNSHSIIAADECLIQHNANNLVAREMKRIAVKKGITAYDETTGRGILRHVMGRVGVATGEVMAVIVTACRQLPREETIIAELRKNIPGLVSIVHNHNPRRTNIILGDTTRTVWGQDYITEKLGDLSFRISAKSFFQVNTEQAMTLYKQALDYAELTGQETVIDVYCGAGTISLFLARQAAKVYGIEIVAEAIKDAETNAAINNITNAEFITGDAAQIMPDLCEKGIQPDVILLDPPRAGCDRPVLDAITAMNPQRIVYVSCNPASLARDVAILTEQGYRVQEAQPVDVFGMTSHVEVATLLIRIS